MKIITDKLSKKCPDKCPKCGLECIAVFRNWNSNGTVQVEFLHKNKFMSDCKITYKQQNAKNRYNNGIRRF